MNMSKLTLLNKKTTLFLLGVIIIIGLVVRIWAIDFGLPFWYHMEEPFYTGAAWNLACKHDADSSLLQSHTYLLGFSIASLRLLPSAAAICETDRPISPLPGRLISVMMGIATIWMVYRLGLSLFNTRAGLVGALFISLNFLHVRESHHGTPDVTAVFLITATLLSYAYIVQKGGTRGRYVIASILTVLSINGRPTAILLLLPFIYAHLMTYSVFQSRSWSAWREALLSPRVPLSIAVMLVAFILVNLRMLVNPIEFLRYWYNFVTLGGRIRYLVDSLPAPLFYLRAIEWGSGLLLALVMGVGFIWAIRRRTFGDILLIGFIIPYFILASISTVYFARYIIPLLPLLGLLAARFLDEILPKSRSTVWLTAVVAILLIQPVVWIEQYDSLLLQTDTRTLARQWIETHIPSKTKIAAEWHSPAITGYDLTTVDFYGLSEKSIESYRQDGYEYLIVSSFIRDFSLHSAEEEKQKRVFYAELANSADLAMEFKPYSGSTEPPFMIDQVLGPLTSLSEFERPGPTIQIYHLRPELGSGLETNKK